MTKKRKGELIVFWSVVIFVVLCLMQNESMRMREDHQHEYEYDVPKHDHHEQHRHGGMFDWVREWGLDEEISQ